MKALVVDDHKINYVLIKNLLNETFPEFETVDTAETVNEALKLLETNNYDLLFLDMKLSDGEGFEVLQDIGEFTFVIVISSHVDYAVEAFKYNVVDYLVKPVKPDDFQKAVSKVLLLNKRLELGKVKEELPDDNFSNHKIFIYHRNDYLVIDPNNIAFIHAQGKYSEIYTNSGEVYVSSKNLKEFENTVKGVMIRIHHSYLVNIASIVSYSKENSTLKLATGKLIPVSVRKREELFKTFRVF